MEHPNDGLLAYYTMLDHNWNYKLGNTCHKSENL
jgi:hypothetical protein